MRQMKIDKTKMVHGITLEDFITIIDLTSKSLKYQFNFNFFHFNWQCNRCQQGIFKKFNNVVTSIFHLNMKRKSNRLNKNTPAKGQVRLRTERQVDIKS